MNWKKIRKKNKKRKNKIRTVLRGPQMFSAIKKDFNQSNMFQKANKLIYNMQLTLAIIIILKIENKNLLITSLV